MEQASKFAETTQILMNVSEFTDVNQATDALISSVQAFGYTADTSMEVVDLLNTIGNNYAISTADLAQSLTKSSASLVAAGGDLSEAAALTATANAIIQDADAVGTALKTTSLRLRGTDVKVLEEEGVDSDGAVTSTSKLRSKVQALSGVDILTETGEYKSTYEILLQISEVWENISDIDQAALLELLAGKRNASVLAAILQNPQDLKAAYEDANDAAGSAWKENKKYLDSIQGKIDQFNNAMQTMWSDTLSSDFVKNVVDLGTALVKLIDKIGPLNIALVGLFAFLEKNYGMFSDLFKPAEESLESIQKKVTKAEDGLVKATAADLRNPTRKTAQNRRDAEERVVIARKQEVGALQTQRDDLRKQQESAQHLANMSDASDEVKKDLAEINRQLDQTNRELAKAEARLSEIDKDYKPTDVTEPVRNAAPNKRQIAGKKSAKTKRENKLRKEGKSDDEIKADPQVQQYTKDIEDAEGALRSYTDAEKAKNAAAAAGVGVTIAGANADQLAKGAQDQKTASIWKEVIAEIARTGSTAASVKATMSQAIANKLAGNSFVQKGLNAMMATGAITAEQLASASALPITTLLSAGIKGLAASFTALWAAIWPVLLIMVILAAVIAVIVGVVKGIDALVKTSAELREELQALKDEIADVQDELKSLNSELEETNKRIDELTSKESLTFSEQEELKNLRAQSAELERQISLLEQKEERLQDQAENKFDHLMSKNLKESDSDGDGKKEVYDKSLNRKMDRYNKKVSKYEEAQQKLAKAEASGSEGQVRRAERQLNRKRKRMEKKYGKFEDELNQYLEDADGIDYATADDKTKEYLDYIYDTQDKMHIQEGGKNAKTNALARIFGPNASDEIQEITADIRAAVSAGEDFELNKDLEKRLMDMGLTAVDVKYYFKELKRAEEEAQEFTTDEAIDASAKLEDQIGRLKEAFDEFNETGMLSANKLMELSETFGGLGNAWSEFVKIMTSGTASTKDAKKAIEELVEATITSALAGERIDDEQYAILWAQLTNLGVDNASELLDGIKEYSHVGEIIANEVLNNKKTVDEAIKAYEEANNVTLTDAQRRVINLTLGAKEAQEQADAFNEGATAIKNYADAYNQAKENEDLYEDKYEDSKDDKSGSFLGISRRTKDDKKATSDLKTKLDDADDATDKAREPIEDLLEEHKDNIVKTIDMYEMFKSEMYNYIAEVTNRRAGLIDDGVKEDAEELQKLLSKQDLSEDEMTRLKELKEEFAKKFLEDGELRTSDEILLLETYFNSPQNFDELEAETDEALEGLKDELGLKAEVTLEDPHELVDKVQSVFDMLSDAAKEYAENGGQVSVDTYQKLLQLEPKYLAMLYNEQGQIELNEDALYQVAQARLYDMTQKQIDSIITGATNAARDGEIDRLKELTEVLYDATEAQSEFNTQGLIGLRQQLANPDLGLSEAEQSEMFNSVKGQVDAVIGAYKVSAGSIDTLRNTLSSSGNTAKDDATDEFQRAMDYWENRIGANQARYEQIQSEIDLLETKGKIAGEEYYQEQIKLENERLSLLEQQKAEAKSFLGTFKEGSDEWWEVANQLNDIEGEIDGVTASIQDLNDAIDEIHWTIFDEAHERFGNIASQLQTVRDLLSADEDSFFNDEGEWTEKGVAVLGTYVQDLKNYENMLKQVQDERKKLRMSDFDSEQEYYDKRQQLIELEQDYATAISDSEQSIVGMYESQIDSVEEYIQTLVDGYNEYIDSVKEALDAERDLYEFKKNIQKQSKDIAEIERRISSLSGSTNKSDIAERRKLEAELYKSRESLNDTYYDHAKDSQSNALDAEQTAYEETLNKFVEGLRVSLDKAKQDMTTFLGNVTNLVMLNAGVILEEYQRTELPLDDTLTSPWKEAKKAVGDYSGDALGLMNTWTQNGFLTTFPETVAKSLKSPWTAGQTAVGAFKTSVDDKMGEVVESIQNNVSSSIVELNKLKGEIANINSTAIKPQIDNGLDDTNGGVKTYGSALLNPEKIKMLQQILNKFFAAGIYENGLYDEATKQAVAKMQKTLSYLDSTVPQDGFFDTNTKNALQKYLNTMNVGSWFRQNNISVPPAMFAKGTMGTTRDQWAITDEPQFGDELVLVPGKDGNLSFMRKGTGVVPADMTQKLWELAQIPTSDLMSKNLTAIVPDITKTDIKNEFNFDSLVHVDHCDQNTLKDLEKMVDNKINDFSKQMNYSLKKFTR